MYQFRISAQRKLKEWWPGIYQFINGFISYIVRTTKQIIFDVLREMGIG